MQRSAAFANFLADRDRQARLFAAGQSLRDDWLKTRDAVLLADTIAQLSARPPADIDTFVSLLDPVTNQPDWIRRLTECWVAALRTDMFADLPWQSQQTPAIQGLTLVQRGRASCSLIVAEGDALLALPQDRITFEHGMTLLWILSGRLRARQFQRDAAGQSIDRGKSMTMQAGDILATDCAQRQLVLTGADGDCVMLRISVTNGPPNVPICEYSMLTGQLTRRGCSDGGTSRMLALLNVAANAESGALLPVLRDLSHHADAALRWQAMRLWIVRDAVSALPVLAAMVGGDDDADVRLAALQTLPIVERAMGIGCRQSVTGTP